MKCRYSYSYIYIWCYRSSKCITNCFKTVLKLLIICTVHCTVLLPGFLYIVSLKKKCNSSKHRTNANTNVVITATLYTPELWMAMCKSNMDNDPNAKKNKQTRRRRKQLFALPTLVCVVGWNQAASCRHRQPVRTKSVPRWVRWCENGRKPCCTLSYKRVRCADELEMGSSCLFNEVRSGQTKASPTLRVNIMSTRRWRDA